MNVSSEKTTTNVLLLLQYIILHLKIRGVRAVRRHYGARLGLALNLTGSGPPPPPPTSHIFITNSTVAGASSLKHIYISLINTFTHYLGQLADTPRHPASCWRARTLLIRQLIVKYNTSLSSFVRYIISERRCLLVDGDKYRLM